MACILYVIRNSRIAAVYLFLPHQRILNSICCLNTGVTKIQTCTGYNINSFRIKRNPEGRCILSHKAEDTCRILIESRIQKLLIGFIFSHSCTILFIKYNTDFLIFIDSYLQRIFFRDFFLVLFIKSGYLYIDSMGCRNIIIIVSQIASLDIKSKAFFIRIIKDLKAIVVFQHEPFIF